MHYMNDYERRLQEKIPGTPAYREKRKNDVKKQTITLLNQRLQRLVKIIPYPIVKENPMLKLALQHANKPVMQATILDLRYRNNFENLSVAIATAEFLLIALPTLPANKQLNLQHSLRPIIQELKWLDGRATNHLTMR